MRVNLRPLDLEDVDLNVLLGDFLKLFLEFVNLGPALTDDESRPCGVNGHGDELEGSFDDNLGEAGLGKTVGQILADLIILSDLLSIVTTTPVRVPTTGDTDSVRNRICLLSHITCSPLLLLVS